MADLEHSRLYANWMWHRSSEHNKWQPVWSVLKGATLFFFTSTDTSLENHIGTLKLTNESTFHYKDGGSNDNGFKFEIHVERKSKPNKFRVKTVYERELWRAYLEGVLKGSVPSGVILSPQDIQMISDQLRGASRNRPANENTPTTRSSLHPKDAQKPGQQRRVSVPSLRSKASSGSSSGGELDPASVASLSLGSFDSGHASDVWPTMNHKFHLSPEKDNTYPSWFFPDCSRELAERILTQCRDVGNTLMRVSLTARNSGSYVISKLVESTGAIVHYEVVRVAEGYRINVENCNSCMRTLTEVMEFFTDLSGRLSSRPMSNNDLQALGIEQSVYSRSISVVRDKQPQSAQLQLPVAINPVNTDSEEEVDLLYEEPQEPAPVSRADSRNHKTWSKESEFSRLVKNKAATLARSSASSTKIQQSLSEKEVFEDLDAVLRNEEQRPSKRNSVASGGQPTSSAPPPLPSLANRPRLDEQGNPIYQNSSAEESATNDRWRNRSQSVPNVAAQFLNAKVPAQVAAPSSLRPGGAKGPPPVTPKPTRQVSAPLQVQNQGLPTQQDILQAMAGLKRVSKPDTTSTPPGDLENNRASNSNSLFSEDPDQLYDDLPDQEYQNL